MNFGIFLVASTTIVFTCASSSQSDSAFREWEGMLRSSVKVQKTGDIMSKKQGHNLRQKLASNLLPTAGEQKFAMDNLVSRLLYGYNKEAILEIPIIVHLDALLFQVKSTIEKDGILESVIALVIEWKDRRIQWYPPGHSNITFLTLSTDQVWIPDIAMTNSAEHPYSISRDSRFRVRASYQGYFRYVPSGVARSWCKLQLITFPFDIQRCWIEFESWSLDSSSLTFDGKSELLIDESFDSMQFHLCDYHAKTYQHTYNFTGETFTRVRFLFTMHRKSTFYIVHFIFPIAVLSFVQTLSFLIPSRDTTADRIAFGTTNMLTLVVYQTIITEELPKTSDSVTALSRYIIALIVIAAFGIIESIIVERIQRCRLLPPIFLVRLFKAIPLVMYETSEQRQRRLNALPGGVSTKINKDSALSALSMIVMGPGGKPPESNRRSNKSVKFLLGDDSDVPRKRLNSSGMGRRDSKKEDAATYMEQLAADPSPLWIELGCKVDFIAFVMSSFSAVSSPMFLFLPLIILNSTDMSCDELKPTDEVLS